MGMAASQARFLGLTARKNNCEYEGQQINQQRTSLSNQSSAYYTDLLSMSVPTVPSVTDYTKTVYTFDDGSLNNTITSLVASTDGKYSVSFTSSWTNDFAAVASTSSIITQTEAYTIDENGDKIQSTDENGDLVVDDAGDPVYETSNVYSIGSTALRELGTSEDEDTNAVESQYSTMLSEKYGDGTWMVRYVTDSTTGSETPYFYKLEDMESATYSSTTGNSQSNIPAYTIGSDTETEETKNVEAQLEQDTSGRLINITLYTDTENPVTYSLVTTTTTDDDGYTDAMNQYEYDCNLYDQAIAEINAKIEIIQEQDKTLELQLTELDTEQSAISTEMDSVSSVIEKNVESTFKTFG